MWQTHIYRTEYYSAVKMNEIVPFAVTWMDLDIIILSELSQTEKDSYHVYHSYNDKSLLRGIYI